MIPSSPQLWSVPPSFPGATAFLLGGGPSLVQDGIGFLHDSDLRETVLVGPSVMIAINRSYRIFPFADFLFFMDHRFFEWESPEPGFTAFKGKKVSFHYENSSLPSNILLLHRGTHTGLSSNPQILCHGTNSGYAAINLAVLLGCTKLILLGYDMSPQNGKLHHYEDYPENTPLETFKTVYLPRYESLVPLLAQQSIQVWNASPSSLLPWWTKCTLQEAFKAVRQENLMEYFLANTGFRGEHSS